MREGMMGRQLLARPHPLPSVAVRRRLSDLAGRILTIAHLGQFQWTQRGTVYLRLPSPL